MALRISLGSLLAWWGLARVINPKMGVSVQGKFYFDLFNSEALQLAFGYAEIAIGCMVMVGFLRVIAMPLQIAITGFSAMTIWTALLDPFALWLPFEKVSGAQHLFYPTVVMLCGAGIMVAFRKVDRLNIDTLLKNRKADPAMMPAE